jgi:hypothetical protein
MADIPKQAFTNAGAAMATQATVSGGDSVRFNGTRTIAVFRNGHSSAITVSMAPVRLNAVQPGTGVAAVPTRSRVVAQNEIAIFDLKPGEVDNYIDGSGNINFTYTGHNALLVAAAIDAS